MKRRSLRDWVRTASIFFVAMGVVASSLGACTPPERNFGEGGGGAGGSGGGMMCTPDTESSCYTGPTETLEVGLCRPGVHVCLPSGQGFGECAGEVLPRPENCLTIEDEGCDGPNPDTCPALGHGWSKGFGGAGEDVITAIAHDPLTGDIVITGYFRATIDFGNSPMASTGANDIFLARFTALGDHLWSKRFGDANRQAAYDVAINASGSIYITGEMWGSADFGDGKPVTSKGDRDAFLVKFDPQGNVVWSRLFGDLKGQAGRAVAITPDGQIVLGGIFSGFIPLAGQELPSQGGNDIFVIKVDASGFDVAARRYGGQDDEELLDLAVDSKGAVYFTGEFTSVNLDFGPAGILGNSGDADAYVAKLGPGLVEDWAISWGDANYQRANTIALSPNDEVFVMGDFAGSFTLPSGTLHAAQMGTRAVLVVGMDSKGTELWSRSTGAGQSFFARQKLAIDTASQAIVAVGYYDGFLAFGDDPSAMITADFVDAFVTKIGWDGKHIASRTLGSKNMKLEALFDVAIGKNGEVFVAGAHQGPNDFGSGEFPAPTEDDIQALLMRLYP